MECERAVQSANQKWHVKPDGASVWCVNQNTGRVVWIQDVCFCVVLRCRTSISVVLMKRHWCECVVCVCERVWCDVSQISQRKWKTERDGSAKADWHTHESFIRHKSTFLYVICFSRLSDRNHANTLNSDWTSCCFCKQPTVTWMSSNDIDTSMKHWCVCDISHFSYFIWL